MDKVSIRPLQKAIESVVPPGRDAQVWEYESPDVSYTLRVMAGQRPIVISTLRRMTTITQIVIIPDLHNNTGCVAISDTSTNYDDNKVDERRIIDEHIAAINESLN